MKKLILIAVFVITQIIAKPQQPPIAVDDYFTAKSNEVVTLNVLQNDSPVDSITVFKILKQPKFGICSLLNNSAILYAGELTFNNNTYDTLSYVIRKNTSNTLQDTANVYIIITKCTNSWFLEANNIKALISNNNANFSSIYGKSYFEVPKGSGKNSMYFQSLWIGAKDLQGNLYFAANRYFNSRKKYPLTPTPEPDERKDFYFGPISDAAIYNTEDYIQKYDRVWSVTKSEIEYHKSHYTSANYTPIDAILNWPGNGNVNQGQAAKLAPFADLNGNGIYEPLQGDYPLIKGDQSVFFIMNDKAGLHTYSMGNALGIEIHGTAYSFNCNDTAFKNLIFLNYKIYNRSNNNYDSAKIGVFSDFDIGYAEDDYVGCDVGRSAYYGYNGDEIDGIGGSGEYGANPPALACIFLKGPKVYPDGIDNPKYTNGNCIMFNNFVSEQYRRNASAINGTYFGDSIIDNERSGLNSFVYFNNSGANNGEPSKDHEYYNYLNSKWKDGTPMRYGKDGMNGVGANALCRYMFPNLTDNCNWGIMPSTNYGIDKNWTEEYSFPYFPNTPSERRGLGAFGGFKLQAGSMEEVEIAYLWSKATSGGRMESVNKLKKNIDSLWVYYLKDKTPCGSNISGIEEKETINNNVGSINVYPIPSNESINLIYKTLNCFAKYYIYDIFGKIVLTDIIKSENTAISLKNLNSGIYMLKVIDGNIILNKKFMKQ